MADELSPPTEYLVHGAWRNCTLSAGFFGRCQVRKELNGTVVRLSYDVHQNGLRFAAESFATVPEGYDVVKGGACGWYGTDRTGQANHFGIIAGGNLMMKMEEGAPDTEDALGEATWRCA